jgi:hypothetical protein
MFRLNNFVLGLFAAGAFLGMFISRAALADNFRVNNEVFANDAKTPSAQSITIFHDGVVYDSMKSPAEVLIFDKQAGRFTLLNPANQTKVELSTDNVADFTKQLQARAAAHRDPVVKFLADPKFQERFDDASGELALSSPLVSYRLVLSTAEGEAAAEQYREFSDWYARLNTLLNPGSRPPFGRLAINEAVAKRKAMATQVILAVASSKAGGHTTTIRSTHRVVRQLTQADLDYVAKIRQLANNFKTISFAEYRKSALK